MNEWEWRLLEDKAPVGTLTIAGVEVKPGHRVRLHPGKRGDMMDIALAGKTAMIESLEQDYDGKFHVCVVVDDDPGRDIGMMRQPGHRFFFDPEEVEPLPMDESEQETDTQHADHFNCRHRQHFSWRRRIRRRSRQPTSESPITQPGESFRLRHSRI